jgi:ParB-like chromosome segregation protein Spo0J
MAPKPKLSPDDIAEIQRLSAKGMSQVELASKYNVRRELIRTALASVSDATGDSGLKLIDYGDIYSSPLNPRKTFDDAEITELAESIAENGLLQNLVVRLRASKLNVEGARLLAAEPIEVQEEILYEHWGNWNEEDADIRVITIEEDDEAIDVSVIRGDLSWRKRQEENRKAYEARVAAHQAGTLPQEEVGDPEDDPPGETPEEKAQRERAQAEREAEWQKRNDEREALEEAKIAEYRAVCTDLPTDWTQAESEDEANQLCMDGCKFRKLLNWNSPQQFHVCINPKSPRAGLLTLENQAGRDCFEA